MKNRCLVCRFPQPDNHWPDCALINIRETVSYIKKDSVSDTKAWFAKAWYDWGCCSVIVLFAILAFLMFITAIIMAGKAI